MKTESEFLTAGGAKYDDLDRRESALNARIAAFENIVRKTKLATAERQEKLAAEEAAISAKWEDLRAALSALTERENDLRRREELLQKEIDKINARESVLKQNTEAFQVRSDQILQKIGEQKEELQSLIKLHLA